MSAAASGVPLGRRVAVKVPATTANLGPGFDSLGLALSLYDELEVTAVAEPGVVVEVHGVGEGEVPTDERNLVASTVAFVIERCGVPAPGLRITAHNAVPHGRGLGSSGAAIVGGIMAAKGLLDGLVELDGQRLLALATELEGHPDNVAPALFGGLTITWVDADGPRYKRLIAHRGVSPFLAVPSTTMSTKLARSLYPPQVPHEDATFNVSRSALLIAALVQSPELLLAATEDRLHQDYRAQAMPETGELIRVLRAEGLAAVVSGAGPSILVLGSSPAQRLRAAELVAEHAATPWQGLMLAVDSRGATVEQRPAGAGESSLRP